MVSQIRSFKSHIQRWHRDLRLPAPGVPAALPVVVAPAAPELHPRRHITGDTERGSHHAPPLGVPHRVADILQRLRCGHLRHPSGILRRSERSCSLLEYPCHAYITICGGAKSCFGHHCFRRLKKMQNGPKFTFSSWWRLKKSFTSTGARPSRGASLLGNRNEILLLRCAAQNGDEKPPPPHCPLTDLHICRSFCLSTPPAPAELL